MANTQTMITLYTITGHETPRTPILAYTQECAHCNTPKKPALTYLELIQCIGRIFPHDAGKRVVRTASGTIQVESDEQRDERLIPY